MRKFTAKNKTLEMTKQEFIELFNNHLNICALPEKEKLEYISKEEFLKRKNKNNL